MKTILFILLVVFFTNTQGQNIFLGKNRSPDIVTGSNSVRLGPSEEYKGTVTLVGYTADLMCTSSRRVNLGSYFYDGTNNQTIMFGVGYSRDTAYSGGNDEKSDTLIVPLGKYKFLKIGNMIYKINTTIEKLYEEVGYDALLGDHVSSEGQVVYGYHP